MTAPTSPSEIARETLRALTARKIAPTPDNYTRIYQEISGATGLSAEAIQTPQQGAQEGKPKIIQDWPRLIRNMLKQLETPHKGITVTRKRDGLETVLNKFSSDSGVLFEKLYGLVQSWSTAPTSISSSELVSQEPEPAVTGPAATAPQAAATIPANAKAYAEMAAQTRELLAQSLEISTSAMPEMANEIQALVQQVRAAADYDQTTRLAKQLRQFWIKMELSGNDKAKIQEGLIRLLRLLTENIGELTSEDQWLHGQVAAIQQIILNPMDKRIIADAERSLRNTIIKQGFLRDNLVDAKTTLKNLMTTFIDRLGEMTESTGEYHAKIEGYSQQIKKADNLAELNTILDDIMHDTRTIQASAQRSHEELISARKQAHDAEERVRKLEQELEQVSELVHEDQLTGALNRRGMDEALDREIKRADRQQSHVSLALLDIDNFKRLNDTLGHQAGDQALVHLTSVIKETLRPSDAVARYGGEEFIIIMPDTGLDEAMETISRLQRELTKKFFLHKNERLLITFSAGVALRASGEDAEVAIGRADKAMYQAKKSGKNRVVAAG